MVANLLLSKTKYHPERLRRRMACWLWILLLAFSSTVAFSQSGAGIIQGTVSDTSGDVVPNVSV
jgi:hypothetical protein